MYLYVAFLTMHGFIEAFSESCNVIYIMLLCFTIEQVLVHNNVFVYYDH